MDWKFSRKILLLVALICSSSAWSQSAINTLSQDAVKEVTVAVGAVEKAPAPNWLIPTQIPFHQGRGDLSLLLTDTQINLLGAKQESYFRRAIEASTSSALSELGMVQVSFNPAFQTVKLHHITIHRASQRIEKLDGLKWRFLQREAQADAGVYTGVVTMAGLLDDLRLGDVLDIGYTVVGSNPVFGDKFSHTSLWASPTAVGQRRVVVNHALARPMKWRWVGQADGQNLEPQVWKTGNTQQLVFRQDVTPIINAEAGVPARITPFLWLQLTEYVSWNEVAQWASTLFPANTDTSDPLVLNLIQRLRTIRDPAERVREALRHVQSEVRYFSVSLGESSHRPYPPAQVLQRRYGDCKDKTWLLMVVLRATGIEANPVLVSTYRRADLDNWLPSPDLFDHAILQVKIGQREYWLDATRAPQLGLLDAQGQIHEGNRVLVAAGNVQQLSTIKSLNAAELMSVDVQETIRVSKLGEPAELEVRSVYRGVLAETIGGALGNRRPDELRRISLDQIKRRYPDSESAADTHLVYDRTLNVLTITEFVRVKEMLREMRGEYVLNYLPWNVISELRAPPAMSTARKYPYQLGQAGQQMRYSISALLPDNVSGALDPSSKTEDTAHYSLLKKRQFRGNVARDEYVLTTKVAEVPPADLAQFEKDWRKSLQDMSATIFLPGASSSKTRQAGETEIQAFARRHRAQIQSTVDVISKTIGEGKLEGPDLAAAHEGRALGLIDLGQNNLAAQDIATALRLSPNSAEAYIVRATLNFRQGDLQRTVADYGRALQLGVTPEMVYRGRAIAQLYMGRTDAALADFRREFEANKDDEQRVWPLIWELSTLNRYKLPQPPEINVRVNRIKTQDWPRPVLNMFLGQGTPADVLKFAQTKSGDDLQLILCEAYFYIGQHYVARGDKSRAKEYFQKSLDQGVLSYTEYSAAPYELKLLD